jgi:hypothetical protein
VPEGPLVATRDAFEPVFRAVTAAPCTTAPLESVTVPAIEPLCAQTDAEKTSTNKPLPRRAFKLPILVFLFFGRLYVCAMNIRIKSFRQNPVFNNLKKKAAS